VCDDGVVEIHAHIYTHRVFVIIIAASMHHSEPHGEAAKEPHEHDATIALSLQPALITSPFSSPFAARTD
jgi:hypothetical protein